MIKTNDFFSANHSLNVQVVILIIFKNIPFTTLFHINPKGNLASDGITSYTEKTGIISSPESEIILKNILYFPKLE